METKKVLNYRIHIDQEKMGKKVVYNALCPTLGLADFGDTIDNALANITKLIEFHIETLTELRRPVPVERDVTTVITSVNVPLPRSAHVASQ